MLQQTRVETVVRYYETFLERFADVSKLAAASEEEVLAAWSGLGYYRRARNLHAAARELAASDVLPRGAAEWGRLPGIGEYTAAAIASIADGQVVAVLDGNVERVVSRLLASTGDPKRAETRRQLKEAAGRLLDVRRPGDSNQALMELGATLCRPREPLCSSCPLEDVCAGRAAGDPERFPRPRRRKRAERVVRQVFVVERDGRFLLFRRSRQERLLAGLWELPWVEGSHRRSWAASLADKYGGDWGVGGGIGRVRHSITHRRFTIDAYLTTWQPDEVAEPVPAG
jgi:A/G-specific adenine glycosylase